LGDGLVASWRDITERKQAEERLRLLESVVVNVNDAVLITAATLIEEPGPRIVYVNEAFTRMTGYSLEEVLGKTPRLLQGAKTDRAALFQIRAALQARQPVEVELINYRKDGSEFWVEMGITPVADDLGKYTHFVALQRDITERKLAESALDQLNANLECQVQERTAQLQQALEFEAMLKRITDKVRDSLDESQIWQTAVQELALGFGLAGCNASWYNLDEGTSTICYEYVTNIPKYRRQAMQMADFPEIYRQLLSGQYFQFCSIVPSPVRGHVAMLACPIMNDEGVLGDLWLINHKDYTFNDLEIRLVQQVANQCAIAIRQARLYQAATAQVEELEKLNQLKDDFLSTVSHELRTPVTNMKMAIHMLQIAPTPSLQQERYLKVLRTECERELELINNLLDLQQLQAMSYSNDLELVNLHDWLPRIIESFQMRTEERQQILRVVLSPSLQPLSSERASLGRLLAELLNNAHKYTPVGGEIVLSVHYNSSRDATCRVSTPSTIFTISNSVEIPASELPHIFEKFYRIPKANRWQHSGTGLGLALVQKLVERLQGTIKAESSNGWTTFTVELPDQPRAETEIAEVGNCNFA
jgi:PAS domain S-box-containing protein